MMLRNRILTASAFVAMASAACAPAWAAGTIAGTTITNNASVNYKVSTIAQTGLASSGTVTVDRVINLAIVDADGGTTVVTPGQTKAVMAFTATNSSNATIDIWITTENLANGATAAHGGTDSFNAVFQGYFGDTNSNGTYDDGIDLPLDFASLDEVAPDTSRTFFLLFNVPADPANGAVAGINSYANAREGGEAGVRGVAITETSGADTTGIDTVFADTAGPGLDAARDGKAGIGDDLTVFTATLSLTRTSKVVSNLVEGTANPKAIPGALVEYCLLVNNAAGGTATDVTVTDALDSDLTYDSTFGVYRNGTVTDGACNADGSPDGSFNASVVTGTIASLAAGETRTVRYRATVK